MESDQGKLFIGGISWDTDENLLKEYFANYGEVLQVTVMREKATGRPRGFGFVAFSDPAVIDRVLQEKHHIDNRDVDVKRAMSREEQSPGGRPGGFNASRSFDSGASVRTKKIFVGGLPPALTSDEFRAYFETYGPVSDAVIMIDQATQRPRGFGFVSFDSEDSVDLVLHKTFHDMNGKQVEVKRALPKDANPGIAGGGRGGSGGFPGYGGGSGGSGYEGGRVDSSSRYMPPQNVGSGYPPYGASGYGTGYGYGSNGVGFGGFGGYGNPAGAPYGNPAGVPGAGFGSGPRSSWGGQAPSGYGNVGYGNAAAPWVGGSLIAEDLDPHIVSHYGIPSTASLLAFDPIQCLLAVGTLDGRIKVIGGDNIEAILSSPKQLPFKNLEFIENQGFLVSISNDNEIEVWDLDLRKTASSLLWESNITAFSILHGTGYMYVGDEYGMVSVVKYNADEGKLVQLPYYVPTDALAEAAGLSSPIDYPVVGLLSQPSSRGTRLLIAFSNGLLFLWDASEDRVVLVRGNKDLPMEGKTANDSLEASHDELSDLELDGKEISSLCWASADGSVLGVGYVDGDILFWDFSEGQKGKTSNHAVKLQLSSAEKRLPVIVMHWCLDVTRKNCGGKLFIYGGDIIGSDEVLTMLALDWSSGLGGLKCVGRVDLTLSGSFADMVLSPIASSRQSGVFLFLLTNPGQLQAYDDTSLASLMSQKENNSSASPLPYPMVVPTMDPRMTVAAFAALNVNDKLSLALSEIVVAAKSRTPRTPSGESAQWPLTGGVPSHLDDYKLERLYIAGYQDGSVRIWDATYPCLSLIYNLKPNANGIDITGVDASVTAISFCPKTSCLAVGNESGMVRLFKLIGHKSGGTLEVVTNTDKKAHHLHQEDGPQWLFAYSFLSSPVCTLRFVQSTRRLAVGFKCGRVAMLDIGAPSVIFVTNSLSDTGSPIESLCVKSSPVPTDQNSISSEALDDLILCAMTKDGQTILFDGNSGKMLASCLKPLKNPTAIRMHIIENCYENSEMPSEKHEKKSHMINASESHSPAGEHNAVTETKFVDQIFENSLFLMCSEDALRLYSLKSLSQGSLESIMEVNLPRLCCWMGTLKKDGRECAVLLLYKTGHIEIRSFPNLEVAGESSLLSLLSWNFKPNMEKTVCSDDFGHVLLVNGCEVAILSFLAHANGFRLPESLPMLHDKVLAAAADATFSHFPVHKKNNDGTPKFLSGIIKGFRSSNEQKVEQVQDFSHLGNIFSSPPYLKPSAIGGDDEKIIELNIDDIEIDEPTNILPSTGKDKKEKKDKRTDKERLFEGASSDAQPKTRTVDEIKAKYRKAGETSAIASQAKDKLLERGEKLERISQRTAELQDGAENFASMAHELAKQMEKRKWWNI